MKRPRKEIYVQKSAVAILKPVVLPKVEVIACVFLVATISLEGCVTNKRVCVLPVGNQREGKISVFSFFHVITDTYRCLYSLSPSPPPHPQALVTSCSFGNTKHFFFISPESYQLSWKSHLGGLR